MHFFQVCSKIHICAVGHSIKVFSLICGALVAFSSLIDVPLCSLRSNPFSWFDTWVKTMLYDLCCYTLQHIPYPLNRRRINIFACEDKFRGFTFIATDHCENVYGSGTLTLHMGYSFDAGTLT